MDKFGNQFFNPEDTAKAILMKSYLPKRCKSPLNPRKQKINRHWLRVLPR